MARDLIGVGSDAKERSAKSCVTLERVMVDSSAGSEIRTRFRAWSSVAEVVIMCCCCCCWQLLLLAVVATLSFRAAGELSARTKTVVDKYFLILTRIGRQIANLRERGFVFTSSVRVICEPSFCSVGRYWAITVSHAILVVAANVMS